MMDERLKKAIEFSNYRNSLFNKKEDIKTKVTAMLLYGYNGGIFKITQELILFVKLILDQEKDQVVLIDSNENPIEIKDIKTFYEHIFTKYFEATNYYNSEYTKLKQARSVSSIYDFIDKT